MLPLVFIIIVLSDVGIFTVMHVVILKKGMVGIRVIIVDVDGIVMVSTVITRIVVMNTCVLL